MADDLAAVRARLNLATAWLNGDLTYVPKDWTPSQAGPDVAALLAAYDAQAARLEEVREQRYQASRSAVYWEGQATAQAARLAAVEAFLRAVQQHGWDAACEVLGDPFAGAAGEGRDG